MRCCMAVVRRLLPVTLADVTPNLEFHTCSQAKKRIFQRSGNSEDGPEFLGRMLRPRLLS